MRRVTMLAAVAVVAALVPAVAFAGGGRPGAAASPSGVSWGHVGGDPGLPVDAPGPAPVDAAVAAAVAGSTPDDDLDLILSLDRPAGPRLRNLLGELGVWSHVFEHVPAAAVRLPANRLGSVRGLDGVVGVYLNEPLQFFLKESAELVNTKRAWDDLGVTGKGVTVAVLDTGVDFTHPDLAPAMKANVKLAEFGDPTPIVPLEGIPNSDTSSGHGTHVAGDVAGRGIASDGAQRGLAPGADLVGIGVGDGLSIFAVLEGFDWILANQERYQIRAVNNSWGTQFEPFDRSDPINLATRVLAESGIVVLFANGNDGAEMTMNPYATAPWVIPVAAGSKNGRVADFSSHGIEGDTVGFGFAKVDVAGETRSPLNMGLYHPAVTTTGEKVVAARSNTTIVPVTAAPEDVQNLPPDQIPFYTTLSGTSMASPETAGVVALVLEAAPNLTPAQVRMVLQVTARPIREIPFHVQGYGYTDASAAVDLALTLVGRSAGEVQATLEELQAARDAEVLSTLHHPTHTYAWMDEAPTVVGSVRHTINVAEGTERLKILTSGPTPPIVGGSTYDVTVTDAAGQEVGTAASSSGTTALEVHLRDVEQPAFGEWTVEIFATGSLVAPMTSPADELLTKREIATIVSLFGPKTPDCRALEDFVPTGVAVYRFQDDDAGGVPHVQNPEYTYVGPVEGGTLGQRTPERKLAGTFGQLTSTAFTPTFATEPLGEPMTIGGPAAVEMWIQGPSDLVQGLLSAQLLDVPPEGDPIVIAETATDIGVNASAVEPLETELPFSLIGPYTVAAGHRLATVVDLSFVGTSAHTLYYDSEEYPSGITVTTGTRQARQDCPAGLPGEDAFHAPPRPRPTGAPPAEPATTAGSRRRH